MINNCQKLPPAELFAPIFYSIPGVLQVGLGLGSGEREEKNTIKCVANWVEEQAGTVPRVHAPEEVKIAEMVVLELFSGSSKIVI